MIKYLLFLLFIAYFDCERVSIGKKKAEQEKSHKHIFKDQEIALRGVASFVKISLLLFVIVILIKLAYLAN